jgi:biopolymer transport protein TolQ
MDKLHEQLRVHRGPAHWALYYAASARGTRDERRHSAARAVERQMAELQDGLATLGTIASTAPFIGLFGTILGVMRAFKDLGSMSGAGPNVVAVGISEALVATATGLFVAIPAVVAYNGFSRRSQRLSEELSWLAEEVQERAPLV